MSFGLITLFILLGSFYWFGATGVEEQDEVNASHKPDEEIEAMKEKLSEFDKLSDENDELNRKLAEKAAEIEELEATIDSLEEEIATLESEEKNDGSSEGENNPDTTNNDSNERDENEPVNDPEPDGSKTVYLTFDDGPSSTTPDILETLNDYDVNGTFFTIGQRMEEHPEIARRTFEEGNMILTHSYSHDYAIYESFDSFYDDLHLAEVAYENVLGFEAPQLLRFPGGSANHSSFDYGGEQFMPELTEDIVDHGYDYVDWNVSSGDASDIYDEPEALLERVKASSSGDVVVPLFHDTDRNVATAEILPEVIEFYKEGSYEFRTFEDISDEELAVLIEEQVVNRPVVR